MAQGIQMSVTIESKKLENKILRMQRRSGKSLTSVLKMAMNLFTQSAVKATRPLEKAKDLQSKKKRKIIPLTPEDSKTFQAFVNNPANRVTNPSSFWKYIQRRFPANHPWRGKYKVHINGRIKKTRIFPSKSQAMKYQSVDHANMMKYSWITAAFKAGVSTTAKRPPATSKAKIQAYLLSRGKLGKNLIGKTVAFLASSVHGVNKLRPYIVAESLRKTKNRLSRALNREEKRIAKA